MLIRITSPHSISANKTSQIMQLVCWALVPGIAVSTYFYGWGTLLNCLLCLGFALLFEVLTGILRNRSIGFYLKDFSALVTALLLAIAVPPYSPWWLLLIGMFSAVIIAKQLFGGLGQNPFNPAMVGYVVLLIAFPLQMTIWVQPVDASLLAQLPFQHSLSIVLGITTYANYLPDGYSGATALDILRLNSELSIQALYQQHAILSQSNIAAVGAEWINISFLITGLWLLYRGVFGWHAPAGLLLALSLCAFIGYDNGSSESYGSPLFHLFTGATMLGAFFIVTDPVSGATSNLGRFIFGLGVGLITYVIRAFGQYPDGIAFGVLLMNFAAPFIDYYTQPRTYGQPKPKRRHFDLT